MKDRLALACMGCMIMFAGCLRLDFRVRRNLDVQTATQIAALIEDAVARNAEPAPLPESVGGVTIGLPAVRRAIETRRVRREAIGRYKAMGCIGENRRGLIHYRPCEQSEHGKVRELVLMLIVAENDDRWTIYDAITKGNQLAPSARKTLQLACRAEHEARASSGELYQTEDGTWMHKP